MRLQVRFSSTDQFCSPKRRRVRRASLASPDAPPSMAEQLGRLYTGGDADMNKTTMAGADPDAAIDFVVRYLGGSPVQQHRGPMGDGPCVKLAWAEFADAHEWHVVRYDTADCAPRPPADTTPRRSPQLGAPPPLRPHPPPDARAAAGVTHDGLRPRYVGYLGYLGYLGHTGYRRGDERRVAPPLRRLRR